MNAEGEMENMRRKDREVSDKAKINKIIAACSCCRLGLNDAGKVYIVPLNFGYEEIGGRSVFYFHGAGEGRKMELIKKTRYAGFELDTSYELQTGESACEYSAKFQSIIGSGKIEIVEECEEKKQALRLIMYQNTGKSDWEFQDRILDKVAVFRLDVEELSCKEHL